MKPELGERSDRPGRSCCPDRPDRPDRSSGLSRRRGRTRGPRHARIRNGASRRAGRTLFVGPGRAATAALAAALGIAGVSALPASAQDDEARETPRFVVALGPDDANAYGRGWSARERRFVSARGTCVDYADTRFNPASRVRITLKTLSRAGGRFLLGLHVAVEQGIETINAAGLRDAARRLASRDPRAFGELCGDAFVAATLMGAQFVGELEVGGGRGTEAYNWLRARRVLGVSKDVEGVTKVLEHFAGVFAPEARWFPTGRRIDVRETTAESLILRARGFPESDAAAEAFPYQALLVEYTDRMHSGLASEFALAVPEEPGAAVFAAMRPQRGRISDMHLARPDRRTLPAPPPRTRGPVFRVERFPVRALRRADVTVYAGPNELPDHFSEWYQGASYWVPGATMGTPRVRAAIASAIASGRVAEAPLVFVRRYATGDAEGHAVYFTRDAPAGEIHSAPGGDGFAWIPGVSAPSTRERNLLANVLRVAAPPAAMADPSAVSAPGAQRPR